MNAEICSLIGGNVRKYREKARLTQQELAEKVNVGVAFISRVERGEKLMKIETLLAFADALQVSAGLLLYQENQNEQLQTIVNLLDGESPQFVDGIISLIGVCKDNFGKPQDDCSSDL